MYKGNNVEPVGKASCKWQCNESKNIAADVF